MSHTSSRLPGTSPSASGERGSTLTARCGLEMRAVLSPAARRNSERLCGGVIDDDVGVHVGDVARSVSQSVS